MFRIFRKTSVKPLNVDDDKCGKSEKKKEYLNTVTIHGLSRVSTGHKNEKTFWSILLMIAITCLIVGIYNLIIKYQSREVFLDIKNVFVEKLKFPSVTICNNVRGDIKYVPNAKIDAKQDDITTAFSENFYNFSKSFRNFCLFGDKTCNIEDFTTEGINGPCITFNQNSQYVQTLPGPYYGLSFIFQRNEPDSSSSFHGNEMNVVVTIHDQSVSYSYYFDGSDISPGITTRIELTKKSTERLPSPFPSNCTLTGGGKNVYIYPGHYTHSLCLQSCFMRELFFKCGGDFSPIYKRYIPASWKTNITSKNSEEFDECLVSNMQRFASFANNRCDCPTPCSETRYIKNIYNLRLNKSKIRQMASDAYFDNFHGNLTDDVVDKSFYHLQIFYPRLEYFIQTEYPTYPLTQAFSDLGGQLGLAFGASTLSMVELLIIFILSICCKNKC